MEAAHDNSVTEPGFLSPKYLQGMSGPPVKCHSACCTLQKQTVSQQTFVSQHCVGSTWGKCDIRSSECLSKLPSHPVLLTTQSRSFLLVIYFHYLGTHVVLWPSSPHNVHPLTCLNMPISLCNERIQESLLLWGPDCLQVELNILSPYHCIQSSPLELITLY